MRLLRFAGRCMRSTWSFLAAVVPTIMRDAIGIAGIVSFSYGAWLIYQPAGFMVVGLFLMAIAVLLARRPA